ncbi:MAG: SidA/IucD/PvdA family monooxygenase [Acidobacteriota bacterium]
MADHIHDLVGVGFGPANLALAALLQEEEEDPGCRTVDRRFLEARLEPTWHPGMMLEGSLIQITVLKDLVTIRNPRSRFTFLNYLREQDRLFEFLNLRDLFPSRVEFADYLGWVAGELARDVRYGRQVERVEPEGVDGRVDHLKIQARNRVTGEFEELRSRHLAVAVGGRPWTPPGIDLQPGGRAFHPKDFLPTLERHFPDRQAPYRFAVVGSGQSGAELFLYLATHYPQAEVTAVVRRFGYKPVDESDFTNEIFFPSMVDFVYDLPEEVRGGVVDSFRDVNYAVVDHPLIRRIYRFLYDERVAGRERARVLPLHQLEGLEEPADGPIRLHLADVLRGQPRTLEVDGAVIATGFEWSSRLPLLEPLAPYIERDGAGDYRIERDYRLATVDGFEPRIYLQGYAEATHGISETVLSLLPIRAQDIARSLAAALEARSLSALSVRS